jgi:DNA-directed RNA polymerase beta' subunit
MASLYSELAYDVEIETVKGIQFSIASPEDIVKRSVAEVLTNQTFDGQEPVPNGLFDPRMGVIENNKRCLTCEQKNTFCPGHFGHIVLAKPVFYHQFWKYVQKVVQCVCFRCSKLLLAPDCPETILAKKLPRAKRLDAISKVCKRKSCNMEGGCGARKPDKCGKDGFIKMAMEWKAEDGGEPVKKILGAEEVLRILQRISNEDADLMGFSPKFNRPEWMICTVMPVPPPAVRPSVRTETGQRMEDDLTHKLCDIIKTNNLIKAKIEKNATKEQLENYVHLLQYHVATFVDNQIPHVGPSTQRMGRPLRTLYERLKSKEGRIRGNLMGKRVDFSARTVITPDPCISIDEIGVPVKIAMNLTFPDVVNVHNREYLTELVRRGPDEYPGAKFIKKHNPFRTLRLRNIDRSSIELDYGDVVDRHLINGDYVLFNRQPSLHKMSMQGHRVRVMPFDTFRLNVCVTKNYNADFDGDEMNIHVPQSLQTRNELMMLASVPTQVLTPKDSKPILSVVQDVALGVYRITKTGVFVTEKQLFNLLCPNPKFYGVTPAPFSETGIGKKLWSGRQLLSTIIPPNVNYKGTNNSFDEKKEDGDPENRVLIECGQIEAGRVDTKIYQDRSKGLVHSIYNEYGPEETRIFFDNTQQLICNWLVLNGFSVGISDLVVDMDTMTSLDAIIRNMKVKVYDIVRNVHTSSFKNDTMLTMNEKFERDVNELLNEAIDKAGKVALQKLDDKTNRMINMIKAGSKGNAVNISQMVGCLGQQNVDGKRIGYGFEHRTLPHYNKYDDGPESRGFVQSSFIKGLTPQEFFFHSMGGREGLIDTAVKSVTGDTAVVVIVNGQCRRVAIGDWIDEALDYRYPDEVRHFEERRMELLDLDAPDRDVVYIPTTDDDGNVTWGRVTAMTRHDPGTELYRIETKGGRRVIVTESKSLIVWNSQEKKFLEMPTPNIKVGDCLPVTMNLSEPPDVVRHLDMKDKTRFDLTRETGIAIGVYLALGIATGVTGVTGVPESIDAMSCAAFFDAITSARTKVPDVTFVAPPEFAKGVLIGYFATGDIGRHGTLYDAVTASRTLAEGLAMACSRLGLFAEMRGARIIVHTLERSIGRREFDHFETVNDVALDPIISIEILDAEAYPKVYDLTIPSTLNFGIANGLQVRDTSQTGYIQRKLVKAMEDCKVAHDMTVRNANGQIIQFLYGEDGIDSIKLENQPLYYVDKTLDKIESDYLISVKDDLSAMMDPVAHKEFLGTPDWQERCFEHYNTLLADRDYIIKRMFGGEIEGAVMAPVGFVRILTNAHTVFKKFKCDGVMSDLNPIYVLDAIEEMCKTLAVSRLAKGTYLFVKLVRMFMSPKQMLKTYGFDRAAFDHIMRMIKCRFYDSLVHPSEMVGVVAAQSIGEPLSQMTLNTFHVSGTALAARATRGVPRIEELTRATKNLKSPSMTIYLAEEYRYDKKKGMEIMNRMETTTFKDVLKASKVYFEPGEMRSTISADAELQDLYNRFSLMHFTDEDNDAAAMHQSPWLLRMEIDRDKMAERDINMIDLSYALNNHFRDRITCMFSDDNASDLIFRIRLTSNDASSTSNGERDSLTEVKALESTVLENVIIKGRDKVKRVAIRERKDVVKYDDETGAFVNAPEWVLDTEGTNLIDALGLPWIDARRTISNDVNEINAVLGIEAARQSLYDELNEVLKDGAKINFRHISLLVDTMTARGSIMSIDRHGINKGDIGPLAKCSFEEVNVTLVKAGVFAEADKVNGVAANIMLGQVAPCGTGDVDVLMDEEAMMRMLLAEDVPEPMAVDADEVRDIGDIRDIRGDVDMAFDFDMPELDASIKKKNVVDL